MDSEGSMTDAEVDEAGALDMRSGPPGTNFTNEQGAERQLFGGGNRQRRKDLERDGLES